MDITLHEGLELFRKKNRQYFSKNTYTPEALEFMNGHDVAHVVFGCDTSIYGEGVVKIWTTFGTNLNFGQVTRGYNSAKAFHLAKKYSVRHVLKHIFRLLFVIPKVIVRSKRMSKPWSFSAYEPYLNTSIAEIRKEFNIEIV